MPIMQLPVRSSRHTFVHDPVALKVWRGTVSSHKEWSSSSSLLYKPYDPGPHTSPPSIPNFRFFRAILYLRTKSRFMTRGTTTSAMTTATGPTVTAACLRDAAERQPTGRGLPATAKTAAVLRAWWDSRRSCGVATAKATTATGRSRPDRLDPSRCRAVVAVGCWPWMPRGRACQPRRPSLPSLRRAACLMAATLGPHPLPLTVVSRVCMAVPRLV